ncbi:multiple epidermal growth factor-like domains protein 10 [Physella acuta]|uniref:multiple epidermal growth factor-like domains protein 10 n=1 Tax=Physella acuta TaxID=109671 RepID=UPI0027DDDE7A|nr:multiple epidermal growth factor-like domains protein 10 [Physella acuta]
MDLPQPQITARDPRYQSIDPVVAKGGRGKSILVRTGKFGLECNKDCRCFTDTGTCSSGCAAGYTGMGCQKTCDEYHYGSQCKLNCSNNCMDSKCNNTDGFCLQCDDNSQGFFCEIEQLKDDRKYEGIAVGIGIGVAIGVVLTSLLVLLAALILYRFKKVSRRRKLDVKQRTTETEPGRIYRTGQYFLELFFSVISRQVQKVSKQC